MDYLKQANLIHKKTGVIDAHFDLAPQILRFRQKGERNVLENKFLKDFIDGNIKVVVAAVFIDNIFIPEMALKLALCQIEALHEDVLECHSFVIATNKAELQKGINNGKIVILISLEGLDPIGNELSLLGIFKKLGVTFAGLTWSRRNYIGDGCHYLSAKEGKKGGLSQFGVEAILEMERVGIIIDVSHLNDEGFEDVLKFSTKPFIASHSNSRTIYCIKRNLTDEMAQSIANRKGVIGINGVDIIVGGKFEQLVSHVSYLIKLVGAKHVGLGLDFCDDSGLSSLPYEQSFDHDVLKTHSDIVNLAAELLRLGHSEWEVESVLFGSFFGFFMENLH